MSNYTNPVKVTAGTFKSNCANTSCQSYKFALLEGCNLFQNKPSLNQTSSSAAELDLQTCSFLSSPSRIEGYELFPSYWQLPKSDRTKGHQHIGDISFQNSKQSLPHSFMYKNYLLNKVGHITILHDHHGRKALFIASCNLS